MACNKRKFENIEFSSLASETVRILQDDEHFTDVTLISDDGKQINAHKVILASSSKYFKNILIQNPDGIPLICLIDVSSVVLELIVKFIYHGECEVDVDFLVNSWIQEKNFKWWDSWSK